MRRSSFEPGCPIVSNSVWDGRRRVLHAEPLKRGPFRLANDHAGAVSLTPSPAVDADRGHRLVDACAHVAARDSLLSGGKAGGLDGLLSGAAQSGSLLCMCIAAAELPADMVALHAMALA